MNHFALFLVCILSVEFFFRLNFLSNLNLILQTTKKVIYVISQDNISDHWKEKIIPVYALKIIKFSLQISIILLCVISLFIISDVFIIGFLTFTFSFIGIIESILFASGYAFLRKEIIK